MHPARSAPTAPAALFPACLAAAVWLSACMFQTKTECDCVQPPVVQQHPDEGQGHQSFCTQLVYHTNPPTSGVHYGIHAAFKTYTDSIPYGFLVHSLEHGAIVIGYNCPEGCAEEVALVQAMIDAFPCDTTPTPPCEGLNLKRFVLAPDPRLDVRWAAAAWDWSWKSGYMDTASLAAFSRSRLDKGPEDLFELGYDDSENGWCPIHPGR
jgi:hypothetical protein